eukprot:TRINITY_DN13090_c0_g1_i1.p1 TRINITY_DN13090_c0_g1~~TRINITY_DN13090_c0_g1_i1.p1  ORF type:complete len:101 (+),score=23.63 TRINITY_DN13090_c0_g1_i1:137-439(+)
MILVGTKREEGEVTGIEEGGEYLSLFLGGNMSLEMGNGIVVTGGFFCGLKIFFEYNKITTFFLLSNVPTSLFKKELPFLKAKNCLCSRLFFFFCFHPRFG